MSSRQFLSTLLLTLGLFTSPARAQIGADGTVGTVVTPAGTTFTITGGTTAGSNLFHSFSDFSVPIGGTALFNNATSITNIFSRVTGGNTSNIDGILRANGTADLFLINPAGIIFGQNASLNLGGSFIATTAESVVFSDGIEFSAVRPERSPLLTVNVPIGLQMGIAPGDIAVRGNGHRLRGGVIFPLNRGNTPNGLQVNSGNTLALIGGNVDLEGGILSATGRIELGAIGRNNTSGQVAIAPASTGWSFNYENINQFNDIRLSQKAFVDAGNSIQMQGRNINLAENSIVLIENQNLQDAQSIEVNATESIEIVGGTNTSGFISTGFYSQAFRGNGGDLELSTPKLIMSDGAKVSTVAFGTANGGHVLFEVEKSIDLTGFQPNNPLNATTINTLNLSSGRGGNITVFSQQLTFANGGNLAGVIYDSGDGGDVYINAQQIEINGVNRINLIPSSIGATNFGKGNLGNVTIDTSTLILRGGASVTSGTSASGNSGNLTINALESIEISGMDISNSSTRIRSSTKLPSVRAQKLFGLPAISTGEAGDIMLNTPQLIVTDGATITVENEGVGNAGSITANADILILENGGSITASNSSGAGGNIQIDAGFFALTDSQISANSISSGGQGGSINIATRNNLQMTRSSITATTTSGNGGDINFQVGGPLLMRDNSLISTTAGQAGAGGNGGNINIVAPFIVGVPTENSDITANAFTGNGGNIKISTNNIFGLKFRPQLTPLSDITASSQFGVSGKVTISRLEVDPSQGLTELPVNLADPSDRIISGCAAAEGNSLIVTGRGGLPLNPSLQVESDRPWSDLRDLSAFREGGNSTVIQAQVPEQIVEANSWRISDRGTIELIATVPHQNIPTNPLNCDGTAAKT